MQYANTIQNFYIFFNFIHNFFCSMLSINIIATAVHVQDL